MEGTERVADWVAAVDARYPERDQESWDASGLQVGDPDDPVTGVLVCLDVVDATLEEAAGRGASLVVAHHPLLFRPLARLTPSTASGRLALRAARAGTAVLAAHTNLDVAVPGTSDPVAAILGLQEPRPLVPHAGRGEGTRVKLVTFVPRDATPAVLGALADAGAGVIGEYDGCSFRVAGTGAFRPSATANPAVGERLARTEVAEDRVEVVVDRARLAATVAALVAAHPYEEVAWDAYPLLAAPPAPGERVKGLGLVGELPAPRPLGELAADLAARLPSPHLRVGGDPSATVRRVAVCGGAGESLIPAALSAGADVLVTGDLRHHVALDARGSGLAVVDAGHHATEAAALPAFAAALEEVARRRGLRARLLRSGVVTDPWDPWRRGTA
jgi:dinuclear metal center YbgI/SA1388 family protein